MDLRDYIAIFRQRWLLIAATTLGALAIAAGLTSTATPQYASSTGLFVSTSQSSGESSALQGSQYSLQRIKSYADLVNQSAIMTRVVDRLDLDETPGQLSQRVSASAQLDTVILTITVTDESPERAQQIAATTAEVFVGYVGELETPPGQDQATLKATVVDEASLPGSPVSPQPTRNLGLGLVLGLLLGAGIAVLRHTLDTSVRSSSAVEEITHAPVIGSIPFDKSAGGAPLLTDIDPYSPRSEAFRVLRTNLQFINPDEHHKVFVVTSALPGEGKSSTTINLALALVENGNKVAVVEGDLRRPRIAEKLGVVGAVGLTTVLVGRSSLSEALQHTEHDLSILTSGRVPPNPAELLQTDAMSRIIDQLRENHDIVLIDAPPLLPVTDAAIIASKVDGAILVVRHGSTTHDQLSGAIERLAGVDARLIASIVNMTPTSKNRSGYGYGYGYGYAPEDPAPSVAEVAEEAPKRRGRSKAPKTTTVLPAPARAEGVDEPDTVDAPQSEADPSTDETESDDVPEVLEALEPPPADDLVDDDGRGWLDASQGLDDEPARAPRPGRRGGR
ncbi:polysaccharide biosynthesis tyrosine autokinase [Aeromicrobium alkaliterrae]|uniref:non-specific protein-tyrosine kinase n=1 Tax=Aeromicrobium alkaliterrae TaxID=302168 RepID=A0ABP4W2C6_9ACTN